MADISLEQQIMEQVRKLSREQQEHVLGYVQSIAPTDFSLAEWLEEATALREELVKKYGKDHFFGVQDALDEIREEASWPRGS